MNPSDFDRLTRPHRRVIRQLLLDFEFFREDVGPLGVFSVESRIKTLDSALRKARTFGLSIEDLHDLAGIRIVVATRPEVEIVRRFFQRRAEIEKDLEFLKDEAVSYPSGYRSTHMVARFSHSVQPGSLEIQIPTIFEHSFNFVSRAWVYKSSTEHSPEWHAEFIELASRLARLDDDAGRLHRTAVDTARVNPGKESLTPLLFQRLVRDHFQETVTMDDAVDYCHWYVSLGVSKLSELSQFFSNSDVLHLWREFSKLEANTETRLAASKSKVLFWGIFGTRMDFARDYLAKMQSAKKKSTD
jgi:ppGpp synthetase/RelA/SpoT-type nucleotidyltranferase